MLDIFRNKAFSVVSLTDAVNKIEYLPTRTLDLGLFEAKGVKTVTVAIEEKGGVLELVQSSERGSPANQNNKDMRKIRDLRCIHLATEDTIPADEILGVRKFGSENEVQDIQSELNERMEKVTRNFDATRENLRIGAIKGLITDADASTIYDLGTEFGVSLPAEVDFDLDAGSPAAGVVRKKCHAVQRGIATALGQAPFQYVHAFCGDAFFDDLISHTEISAAYERWVANGQVGEFLRVGMAYSSLLYAGILFENYRGSVNGTALIHTDKCRFFPVGVPGLFKEYFAPADFVETVNTVGLPRYAKVATDTEFQRWVKLHVQSNPLPLCTRPAVLYSAKRT